MLYISKIDDYLEILTDEEIKDFVDINFSEFIKEEQNLRKVAKLLYYFLTTTDKVQSNSSDNCIHYCNLKILYLFDPELQLINTKPEIQNKLKALLNELKKFKVQAVLVLGYKKRNDHQIFPSITKLIASDSDIDEAFKSMHQNIITKIKNYSCEDWNVLDAIIKHSIKIFEC